MLGDDLTFGANHDAFSVYAHTDRAVGERGRHTVAVTLEGDEAGWRNPLGMLDKAVERRGHAHQMRPLIGPDLGDRALGLLGVMDLVPKLPAALLEPHVHLTQLGKPRRVMEQPGPRILDVLLDLAFLPSGARRAELCFKQKMARHRP